MYNLSYLGQDRLGFFVVTYQYCVLTTFLVYLYAASEFYVIDSMVIM